MRIIKADIVGHFDSKGNRYAVYSMDVQPNSNRLATGGGGKLLLNKVSAATPDAHLTLQTAASSYGTSMPS